jgi:16S rRNA (uracil1498-N3)-methyltransferase
VNLVIVEPGEVPDTGRVKLSGLRAAHLIHVLNVAPGQEVRVGILDGARGIGTVQRVDEATVELDCSFETTIADRPQVDLLLALPRPKIMRRLWAQLAALGVGRIILTNAERVERNYFDTHVLEPECYRPLLIEGLRQAQDTRLPQISIHRRFRVLIEDELDDMETGSTRLVAHPSPATSVREIARTHGGGRVLLAVGPEGGWNSFELALLDANGFQMVSMGRRTLRTDTACVALLAVIHHTLEAHAHESR